MFSDSVEETLTLTMADLHLQLPRTLSPPSPPPQPPSLFSTSTLKASSPPNTSGEVVDFSDSGFDFYPSLFDNSFPYRGILNDERTFSSSSPTSNASFLSETSFNAQSLLKTTQDSGIPSDNFGLLTTNSSPYRGNGSIGQDLQGMFNGGGSPPSTNDFLGGGKGLYLPPVGFPTNQLNDSGLSSMGACSQKWESPKTSTSTPGNQFDFSFSVSDTSSIIGGGVRSNNGSNNSNASADSPTRIISQAIPNFANQWNSSDVSSLLDNLSAESSCSSSVITTSALGNSIWSSSQVSPANTNNEQANNNGNNAPGSSNGQQWDVSLAGLSKQQLLAFVQLLMKTHEDCNRNGDNAISEQLQAAIVQVQQHIITAFVSEPAGSECSGGSTQMTSATSPLLPSPTEQSLDRVAEMHRDIAGSKDAPYTWSGQLPPRIHRHPVTYSCKVFLGGLPFDITECILIQAFEPFGMVKIEWPGKQGNSTKIKGYAYAIFESEKQVKQLLQSCTHDYSNSRSGNYYYKVSSKRYRCKDVQIIPWALSDSNYVRCQASKIDPLKTVFVGALHGMVNAEGLATIMDDLFGGVVYAGVDTDRSKYPIGSARVTFSNTRSYMKAVRAAFVLIKTSRFVKKVQVDPYLEDATCSVCNLQQGPYFCRDSACFSYYCRTCFQHKHAEGSFRAHRPMMRTANNKQGQGGNSVNKSNSSTIAQGIRFAYQHNNHGMNGGNNHHYNGHNFYNNHHHRGGWNGNNNGGRYEHWRVGGGRNSPPMMSHNNLNGNTSPIAMNGAFGPGKLNNLSGDRFSFGGNNNGEFNGYGQQQQQQIPSSSFNNNRNFDHDGYRRQQVMRWP